VVDGAAQATAAANTPFQGRELPGRVVATFLRGRATVLDGAPVEPDDVRGAAAPAGAPGVAR
jgi:dihydroorotase